MRKILLTTVAVFGAAAGLAGGAYAQSAAPSLPSANGMWGVGGAGAPPTNSSESAAAGMPAPGSFVVHLNGRLNYYVGVEGDTANNITSASGVTNKNGSFETQGYIRLYPGFDAVAANGLQYGAVGEIRNPGANDTATGVSASGNSTENTLYWRIAYGYLGLPEFGTLSFGQQQTAFGLLDVGAFVGFNDGGWDGDVPSFIGGGLGSSYGPAPDYPFTGVGPMYTVNRLLYMSPDFSGFRFGIGYAPNNNSLINQENCTVASPGCNRFISGDVPTPGTVGGVRYNNVVDAAANYTNTFGPLGLALYGGFYGATPIVSTVPGALKYEPMAVGAFGATVSFAGFTVGGQFKWGDENGLWDVMPQGGKPMTAWLVGAQYQTGPVVIGASYFTYQYTGDFTSPATEGMETDNGIAAGGTFSVAPGLSFYLSYLYGQRHQLGFNFNTGIANGLPGGGVAGTNNNASGQVFALGTVLKW